MNNKYKIPSKITFGSIIGLFLIIALVFSSVFFIPSLIGFFKGGLSLLVNPANDKSASAKLIEDTSDFSAADLQEELQIAGRGGVDIKLTVKEIMAGYSDAKRQHLSAHSDCKKIEQPLPREGCNRYVTGQKHFPPHVRQGDFDQGKKTQQCLTEVNAYYDFLIGDLLEQKEEGVIIEKMRTLKQTELDECNLYDAKSELTKNKSVLNLNLVIEKVEQNGLASDQDLTLVLSDAISDVKFTNNNEKDEFIKNIQGFIQMVDAEANSSDPLSCNQIEAKAGFLLSIQKEVELAINQAQQKRWEDNFWEYKKSLRRLLLWHRMALIDKGSTTGCVISSQAT